MNSRNLADTSGDLVVAASEPLTGGALVWTSFVILVTAGLLLVAAYTGAKGKLHPNPLFGIRTDLTLSDDEAWYEVQRKSAPWMAAAGTATAVGGVSLILVNDGDMQMIMLLASLAVCVTLVIAGALMSSRAVRDERARRDRTTDENHSERGEE
ncbi:SdpI family protein [Lipingzhangella sp. LS1_29]|uniref:SdpI family protein n=1 Tax=Lipingzhangella rawalii TaxID=2055835 RepID=A0ABU2H7X8_9ACTN|nr:SdpI family protein [Lipingzhangella rawalii]MDS1271407.1 SdpI family protein [Lipingzhangella rawalii]